MEFNREAIQAVYDHSPIAFCVIRVLMDGEGREVDFVYEYANQALAELDGVTVDTLLGNRFYSVFNGMDQDWLHRYAQVARTGAPAAFTKYCSTLKKYLCSHCYRISHDLCGCLMADVTHEQQEPGTVIDNLPGGVFWYDADSDELEFVSDPMLRMLGYTKEEFTQAYTGQRQLRHPQRRRGV